MRKSKKQLSSEQTKELLDTLEARFEAHPHRHREAYWTAVRSKLEAGPKKLRSLHEMERPGDEPDVVGYDEKTGEYLFFHCSPESPKGRVPVCYDREGLESR